MRPLLRAYPTGRQEEREEGWEVCRRTPARGSGPAGQGAGGDAGGECLATALCPPTADEAGDTEKVGDRSAAGVGAHGCEEVEPAARRGSPSARSWRPAAGGQRWEVGGWWMRGERIRWRRCGELVKG
jgi:hypothetical protein